MTMRRPSADPVHGAGLPVRAARSGPPARAEIEVNVNRGDVQPCRSPFRPSAGTQVGADIAQE
jgi:hypothetical protein